MRDVRGGYPVIGLSGRGKRLDKVLFTLLHEIAHILRGHVDTDRLIVENLDDGHAQESIDEREANEGAVGWIFPSDIHRSLHGSTRHGRSDGSRTRARAHHSDRSIAETRSPGLANDLAKNAPSVSEFFRTGSSNRCRIFTLERLAPREGRPTLLRASTVGHQLCTHF